MERCETCGNEYASTFSVTLNGKTHIFDSFECAISALAPHCTRCDVRVLGHGVEADGDIYCGAHCANQSGVEAAVDHV